MLHVKKNANVIYMNIYVLAFTRGDYYLFLDSVQSEEWVLKLEIP